ncbi:hypothetical protein N7481_010906 [Penicillium waksmanii]|uniref:uncharacterized protein n=1 Tax=Penicillium waksmanii TaxID=69791 RepID=UPI0025485DC9|nr:uncharacterized protein N7481_010906 [Penicillium waksmanii]KAJ5973696.1 hypothetical protein N7481_010906 [Penicillium waksmanii]
MTSSTEGLELAQLAFYAFASLPSIYCIVKHGKVGLLGWLYVFVMCGLRLVGNGVAYHALSTTGEPNKAASIISGIGLSPLLLAAIGILRESWDFNYRSNHSIQSKLPVFLGGFGMLIPHLVVGGGIGLAAASGNNKTLLEVGLIIFATGWIMVVGLVVLSAKSNDHRSRLEEETKLLHAVMIALPLIGIRLIYAIAIVFKYKNAAGGSLAVQVIFGTLPEFLVMITYLSAGLVTHNLARSRYQNKPGPASASNYTSVRV